MKYLKLFENFDENEKLSNNVKQIEVNVSDDKIKYYMNKYPNKWILFNKELNYIWIKDKPELFSGSIPDKVYHVSNVPNLDKIGIKPSSETSTPFGYYDFTFLYLFKEDIEYGSIPYEFGVNYLYEIDTNIPNIKWYEGFNEELDGEENITTNCFIPAEYIEKIVYD